MYRYIYMYHTADSLCCTVGTNSALQSNDTTIKIHYKRKKEYSRFHLLVTRWVSSLVWACPSFAGLTRDSAYRCGHLQLDQGTVAKDSLAHKSGSWCWLSGGPHSPHGYLILKEVRLGCFTWRYQGIKKATTNCEEVLLCHP